jgi:hypothetical protein
MKNQKPSLLAVAHALRLLCPAITRAELFTLIAKNPSGPGPVYKYWYGTGTTSQPVLPWERRDAMERILALEKARSLLAMENDAPLYLAQVTEVLTGVTVQLLGGVK